MSKRMTSETIIFDTDWLTEADFIEGTVYASIDYQAYDTLKIIVQIEGVEFSIGGVFQEFDVYRLENYGPDYQTLLAEGTEEAFSIDLVKAEGYFTLTFRLNEDYWENELKDIDSIYIKGVKR